MLKIILFFKAKMENHSEKLYGVIIVDYLSSHKEKFNRKKVQKCHILSF